MGNGAQCVLAFMQELVKEEAVLTTQLAQLERKVALPEPCLALHQPDAGPSPP